MRLIWHEALWLLLAVPILIGAYAYECIVRRAAESRTTRYTDLNPVSEAAGALQWIRRRVPTLLFLLGITGLCGSASCRSLRMHHTHCHERVVQTAATLSEVPNKDISRLPNEVPRPCILDGARMVPS